MDGKDNSINIFNTIENVASELSKTIKSRFPDETNVTSLLFKTVKCLGGQIVGTNKPEYYEVNGGSLLIKNIGNFIIKLPMDTSPLSDNFTIAHELGHYFLHYKDGMGEKIYARYGNGVFEVQANRFAAAFLMPKDEFLKAKKELEGDVLRMAAKFQVPIDIIKKRLEYINE